MKISMLMIQFVAGTPARAHWGRARVPVCNALLKRAGRLLDEYGLWYKPSLTGLQALCLYNQMMHMSDQGSRDSSTFMQSKLDIKFRAKGVLP